MYVSNILNNSVFIFYKIRTHAYTHIHAYTLSLTHTQTNSSLLFEAKIAQVSTSCYLYWYTFLNIYLIPLGHAWQIKPMFEQFVIKCAYDQNQSNWIWISSWSIETKVARESLEVNYCDLVMLKSHCVLTSYWSIILHRW